jgi:hypothetical protein
LNIYWSKRILGVNDLNSETGLLSEKPESLLSYFSKNLFPNNENYKHYMQCPAAQVEFKNTYVVKADFDIEFFIDTNKKIVNFHSSYELGENTKKVFTENNYLNLSTDNSLFNILTNLYLFSEESIQVAQLPPYFHKKDYVATQQNMYLLPGSFDISKWYRPFQASYLVENSGHIKLKRGDPLYYIRFNTDQKINLIEYELNDKLIAYAQDCMNVKLYRPLQKFNFLYKMFAEKNIRKKILKEIVK